MTTKTTLRYLSFRGATENTTHVFEFIDNSGSCLDIFLDRILIVEKITAFDGIVHMLFPAIRLRISKRSCNSTLGCPGMRTGGINLGQHGDIELFTNLKSAAHSCKTSTYDHYIMFDHKNTSKRGKHFNLGHIQ